MEVDGPTEDEGWSVRGVSLRGLGSDSPPSEITDCEAKRLWDDGKGHTMSDEDENIPVGHHCHCRVIKVSCSGRRRRCKGIW